MWEIPANKEKDVCIVPYIVLYRPYSVNSILIPRIASILQKISMQLPLFVWFFFLLASPPYPTGNSNRVSYFVLKTLALEQVQSISSFNKRIEGGPAPDVLLLSKINCLKYFKHGWFIEGFHDSHTEVQNSNMIFLAVRK